MNRPDDPRRRDQKSDLRSASGKKAFAKVTMPPREDGRHKISPSGKPAYFNVPLPPEIDARGRKVYGRFRVDRDVNEAASRVVRELIG